MNQSLLRVAYILTTFPCRTEVFAAREIEALRRLGFDITVLAAVCDVDMVGPIEMTRVVYRPSVLSVQAAFSLGYMIAKYPLALCRLFWLVVRLLASYPRDALTVVGNLHTIGFFARHLDRCAISHVHAYFLSWPAVIGLAISVAVGRSFSISAHARDVFVEHGAAELKISRAKFVAACTVQGLGYLKRTLPTKYHDRLQLCYHGAGSDSANTAGRGRMAPEPKRADTVIAVARLIPKKGLDGLLRAFARVLEEKPQCRLRIVGDGPERNKLKSLIEQFGIDSHVQLVGWLGPDETARLMEQATMLVVPSVVADDGDRDGIPNVILEAFIMGTPVIASRLDGIMEAVEHESTGLLVGSGDTAGLASAIKRLLDDGDLRHLLAKNAHETVVRRFSSTRAAERMGKLFADVIL